MTAKAEPARSAVPNRCACGHFPTDHMVVRSMSEGGGGSFALLPEGPCVRCGASCSRYSPTP